MGKYYNQTRLESQIHLTEEEYKKNQSNNAKSARWTVAESEKFKELYQQKLSYEEIGKIMREEFGNREYTGKSLCNKRMRMGLPPSFERLDMRAKFNPDTLNSQFDLLKDEGTGKIIVKCKKCGEVSSKQRKGAAHGCRYCKQKPNDSQDIYVIEFTNFKIPSIKVGISHSYETSRKQGFPKHKLLKLFKTKYGKAIKIEELMQDLYGLYRTNPEELVGKGHTECFHPSQKEQIIKSIEEKLHG